MAGGQGNDLLAGGGGADILTGGTGSDIFQYQISSNSMAESSDIITDFVTQFDAIDLTALSATSISVARLNGASVVYAQTPGGAFQLFATGATLNANDFTYTGSFGVYVIGSEGNDTIVGSSRPDPLVGNDGADTITGGGGADAIAGGAGRDVFRYVSQGDSNQTTGFDNLYDFVTGEDRVDLQLIGATSISILRTDNGSSFIYAETAQGVFLTTAAGRTVQATDITYGNGFGIYLVGSSVNDVLIGTSLADPIAGGAGNDTITGGGGADAMFGDAGADTFVYVAASDSTAAATDGIFGFVSGTDRLDLRLVRTGAADTFGIAYLQGGSFLFVDLGGNGSTDMVIGLANTTLVASDILWATGAIGEEPAVKDAGPQTLPGADEIDVFDTDMAFDLSPHSGRYMLDLEGARGFHGQDWYV
ncbi:M10 family metallopeptidase C-terminal domain-containing protein [Brevundimonas sp. NIBR10]|uniref:M10 family metallopeptidase C-terminal domain-containing protein n=1 Tax=Brevundimonas sp. NIBR10 TaxID=3015997 RepID=UPI0022F18548|nr:M10 family metallopeptidase C-terminal domain-containing protein [Brevundimonas sp. NIBR10]